MSDKRAHQPAVDAPLSDELARCESMLAAIPLPVSRLDRDELLYRAGWAAAQTQVNGSNAIRTQLSRDANVRSTLVWSGASALMAASLATIVVLQLPSSVGKSSLGRVEVAKPDEPTITLVQVETSPVVPDELTIKRSAPLRREVWNASLLNMRERALRGEWDDFPAVAQDLPSRRAFDDNSSIRSKTSRELLREFTSPKS